MFDEWWVWVAAGLALGIVELLVPGFLFAGFAIGAVLTGAIIGLGIPGSGWMNVTPVNALLVFAVLSVVAWLSMRAIVGVRHGQVKRIDRDINDN
ncbi:NfeD family protein [Pararhodobacter oceanensis]|uniref:NfeD family protein n=1 Tax=Pararhodobacter oceanensis TaxID=2172121 RepID=UPI003A950B19